MTIGAFSISLAVKDLDASRSFYNHLGFDVFAGNISQGYLILKNGEHLVGLFQGMFEGNILTFNPGWTQSAETIEGFEDVRALHQRLNAAGIETMAENGLNDDGAGSFMIQDPDGNTILIDQHVPKPT